MGDDHDGLADPLDHRDDVLDLALARVLAGVAAQPAAAPVHGQDGVVLGQGGHDRRPARVVGGGPVDEQQRRAFAGPLAADLGAVGGAEALDGGGHAAILAHARGPRQGRRTRA